MHRAGSAWVGWPATGEVFKQLMFEFLMLDGSGVLAGVLSLLASILLVS